jgi:hypothetical protein
MPAVLGNLHALIDTKRVNHMASMRSLNAWLGRWRRDCDCWGPEDCGDPMERQIWGTWREGQMVAYSS